MAQSQKYAKFTGWGIDAYWECLLKHERCSRVNFSTNKPMCKGCWVEKQTREWRKKLKKFQKSG